MREGFEGDEGEAGRQRGEEMWKDHKGAGVADLEGLARHRGSQPHPKLPRRDPEAREPLVLEAQVGWGNGGIWGPRRDDQ